MPNNHVIIGLGGTGGNVLLQFRKILWTEHRNLEPRYWNEADQRWSDPAANIAYLYVDSNDKELNQSDGLWECLGQSVALNKSEKLLVRDA
ncbi:MAG TPA: tubulin-like doman-containing protein, partial [Verrucomicrobiae bacterium]